MPVPTHLPSLPPPLWSRCPQRVPQALPTPTLGLLPSSDPQWLPAFLRMASKLCSQASEFGGLRGKPPVNSPRLGTCSSSIWDALSSSLWGQSSSPHQTGGLRRWERHTVGLRAERGMTQRRTGESRGALPPRVLSLLGFGPSAPECQLRVQDQGCRGGGAGTRGPRQGARVGVSGAAHLGRAQATAPEPLGAAAAGGGGRGQSGQGRGRRCGDTAAREPARPAPPRGALQVGAVGVWGQPVASKSGCCSWGVGKQQGAPLAVDSWPGVGPQ